MFFSVGEIFLWKYLVLVISHPALHFRNVAISYKCNQKVTASKTKHCLKKCFRIKEICKKLRLFLWCIFHKLAQVEVMIFCTVGQVVWFKCTFFLNSISCTIQMGLLASWWCASWVQICGFDESWSNLLLGFYHSTALHDTGGKTGHFYS